MTTKKATTKNFVIFDIDSASVAGGFFSCSFDTQGTLVELREHFATRDAINTKGSYRSFEHFFDMTLKTLDTVANDVYLQSQSNIDEVFLNVSIPWMSAQKRIIKYHKKNSFVFTQELADDLIQKDLASSLKKTLDYKDHEVELIDRKTIDVYGNGYPLRKPLGKEMSECEIHSLSSVMSRATKEKFIHRLERVFHRLPILSSNTWMNYYALTKQHPYCDSALVIDISGEVTELIVVERDHLKHIGSIPIGSNAVLRSLADAVDVSFTKAESLMRLYHEGNLETDYQKYLKPFFEASFMLWFRELYALCDEFSKEGLLPRTLVMKSSHDIDHWFGQALLKQEELALHMRTDGPLALQYMFQDEVSGSTTSADRELYMVARNIGLHYEQN